MERSNQTGLKDEEQAQSYINFDDCHATRCKKCNRILFVGLLVPGSKIKVLCKFCRSWFISRYM